MTSVVRLIAKYRIIYVNSPVPETNIYRMEPLEGSPLRFTPGQFVFIHILDDNGKSVEKKPYSVSSSPSAPYLEFCIKMVHGRLTGRLEKLSKGSVVGIEGPFGHFTFGGQDNAAFIGGGTGIAPFMAMLRHIAEKGLDGKYLLFYSAKTRDSIIYAEELARLQKMNPNIKVVITLTRETSGSWPGECGRITHEMLRKHVTEPGAFNWWVCGPMEMLNSMKACLSGMGVDTKKIAMEGWG
jgi:ferredoxin-NADP reductase